MSGESDSTFPTSLADTITGKIKVSDQGYTADGKLRDARGDASIDVNAQPGLDMSTASRGCKAAVIQTDDIASSGSGGGAGLTQENPNQTFLPREDDDLD